MIMTSLARIYRKQGRPAEAHDLLVPLYSWFAEGFDTPDLKETKAFVTSSVVDSNDGVAIRSPVALPLGILQRCKIRSSSQFARL
jgi:hypothetical protein